MWRNAFRLLAKRMPPFSLRTGRSPTRRLGQRRSGGSALYSLGALRNALGGNTGVRSLSPAMRKRLVELLSARSSKTKKHKSLSTVRSSPRIHGGYISRNRSGGGSSSSATLREGTKKRKVLGSKKYSRKTSPSRRRITGKSNSKLHSAAKKLRMRRSRTHSAKRRKRKGKGKLLSNRGSKKMLLTSPGESMKAPPLANGKTLLPSNAPERSEAHAMKPVEAAASAAVVPILHSSGVPQPASSLQVASQNSVRGVPGGSPLNHSESSATGRSASFSALPSSLLGNGTPSASNSNRSPPTGSSTSTVLDPPPRINYHLATAVATVVVPAVANEMLEGMRHVVTRASRDGNLSERTSAASAQQMEEYYMASKGPLFATAVIAGTNAVKLSSTILPLCQPVGIQKCSFTFRRRSLPQSLRPSGLPHRVVLRKRATPPSSIVPKRPEYSVLYCFCTVATSEKKAGGVEMEALAGATVAATTMYDMLRQLPSSQEDGLMLGEAFVLAKRGGQGDFIKLLMSESTPPSTAVIRPNHAAPSPSTAFPPSPLPHYSPRPPPAATGAPVFPPPPRSLSSSYPTSSQPPLASSSFSVPPRREEKQEERAPLPQPQVSRSSSQKEHKEELAKLVKSSREDITHKHLEAKSGIKSKETKEEVEEVEEEDEERVEERIIEEKEEKEEQHLRKKKDSKVVTREIGVSSGQVSHSHSTASSRSSSPRSEGRSLTEGTTPLTPPSVQQSPSVAEKGENPLPMLDQNLSNTTQLSSSMNKKARAPAPPVDTSVVPAAVPPHLPGELPITRGSTTSGDVVSWWQSTPQERRLQEYNPRRRYGEGRLSPITLADKKVPRGKEKMDKDEESKQKNNIEEERGEENGLSTISSKSSQISSFPPKKLKRKKIVKIIRKTHACTTAPTSSSPQIPDYTEDEENTMGQEQVEEGATYASMKPSTQHRKQERTKDTELVENDEHQKPKREESPSTSVKNSKFDLSKRSAGERRQKEHHDDEEEGENDDSSSSYSAESKEIPSLESKKSILVSKSKEPAHGRGEGKRSETQNSDLEEEEEYSPVNHSDWDTLTTRIDEDDELSDEMKTEKNKKSSVSGKDDISSLKDSEEKKNFSRYEEDDDYMLPPPREKPSSATKKKRKKIPY